ncbi:type I secretion system permease/ATPase [Frigidibacter sp. ROC022]|uniref:type I secretion system permease/ATPase n=1 Tax=Frigidibacter sp. ROC022 TaxID=2971796 RepID=UPI00215ADFCF|nr:type I secretion system permease/ATPase [Frigidibacter sp. ROC022]MCR8724867.1 type I secretion system permease/ATPase [Frigidibacter sp. ROC022]
MTPAETGRAELREIRKQSRALFWTVGLFSLFVNLLMLTGPIFMLQVYDRVLGSRSEETLLALVILMGFLFTMMGILDFARNRIMARVGARFQAQLDRRVFSAVMRRAALGTRQGETVNNLRDLEAIQRMFSSPVFLALFDLPFVPLFLAGIAIFHPWLGILALCGGGFLVLVAILNQMTSAPALNKANAAMIRAERMASQIQVEAEMVRSLGMLDNAYDRWNQARAESLETSIRAADVAAGYTSLSKTFRMFLQSAMLGLAALLVLRVEVTAGVMIAASILLGRALAPVDMLVGQWQVVQRAWKGWGTLATTLGEMPVDPPRTALPRPKAHLIVQNLTVVPPGQQQASLRMINAEVRPGEALGIIGPSGSGKSTLARTITGVWRPAGGLIRLGGATLEQFDPAVLGRHIGYLPQRVQLFDGTIAENIAGLSLTPNSEAVVAAAQKSGAHDIIVDLPEGYDTRVSAGGGRLSGGQMQRIGLARAMYGDPVLLVLDEPNSNLDNEGSQALNLAIRQMKSEGRSVIIMAHRPAAIQECDMLLVLENGMRKAFGKRDEVLSETVLNHKQIARGTTGGIR